MNEPTGRRLIAGAGLYSIWQAICTTMPQIGASGPLLRQWTRGSHRRGLLDRSSFSRQSFARAGHAVNWVAPGPLVPT